MQSKVGKSLKLEDLFFRNFLRNVPYQRLSLRLNGLVNILYQHRVGGEIQTESTAGKKMAAVHLTTMPREPITAYKAQGKPNFYIDCPCSKDIK